jgi:hypothetical protein
VSVTPLASTAGYSHFRLNEQGTGYVNPFDKGWRANARMFFHLTAAAEAESLAVDEPEPLLEMLF